jgi:hypothetical protein
MKITISSIIIFFVGVALLSSSAVARPMPPTMCADGSQTCDPVDIPILGGAKKWNPGHYVKTQGNHAQDQDTYFAGVQRNLDAHVESSDIFLGAMVLYAWGALETEEGVYDWSRIYANLNWLAARGKYLIVDVEPKSFGEGNPEWVVPENLETEGDGWDSYGSGINAALWREHVATQAIAFLQAFAQEFDGHPNLEMVSFGGESCQSWGQSPTGAPSDYSNAALLAQRERIVEAMVEAFEQTIVVEPWNCSQGGTIVDGMEHTYLAGAGHASPDSHDDEGNVRFRGELDAIRDYRGLIAHRTIVSSPNLGGKDSILPLSNIQSLIESGDMTHVAWVLSSSASGGTKGDIIAHLETAGNYIHQSCPTVYMGMCNAN